MRTNRWQAMAIGALAGSFLVGGSAGCAPKYEDLQAFVQAHTHDVAATRYRLDPPDAITILSPTAPELDNVTARIGVDGKITLNLVGSVKVSKLTPREVATKLEDLLRRYYVDPTVHVYVSSYASKQIYVFGQVSSQGPMPFTGRDTVLDVLARARMTFIAWGSRVSVIRPSAVEEDRRKLTVDVDRMMQNGDLQANFLLEEGDIIYVPATPLGWVGLRMQELLFPAHNVMGTYQVPLQARDTTDAYQVR